jgi:hypothetical protein
MRQQFIVLTYEADSIKEAGNKLSELVEDYLLDDWYFVGGIATTVSDGMFTVSQGMVRSIG